MQHLETPLVLSYPSKKGSLGDTDNRASLPTPKSFILAKHWSFYWEVFSDHCNNIYHPSHTYTAWNTTDKMHNTILPEYFHHGSPPKNSPTAHLHCQFFLHIRPLSRSWQLWHLVHPGNLGSRTEWQWCFHTWFVRVQVDYWGEFNLCYSTSAHIVLQRILHWITALQWWMSCLSTQQALNYRRHS